MGTPAIYQVINNMGYSQHFHITKDGYPKGARWKWEKAVEYLRSKTTDCFICAFCSCHTLDGSNIESINFDGDFSKDEWSHIPYYHVLSEERIQCYSTLDLEEELLEVQSE